MILPGVDEFTLVLQVENSLLVEDFSWSKIALLTAEKFIEQTHLNTLFGQHDFVMNGTAGYTNHISYTNQPFNGFYISWHENRNIMGVVVSFSASSWLFYRKYFKEKFGIDITIVDFILLAESDEWSSRLSRIDFYVDYKNEGLSVDKVYSSVERGTSKVIHADGRTNTSKQEVYMTNGEVKTFYLGSRSKNTRLRFRLYDKKFEQESKGSEALHLIESNNLDDWVRLEVTFKKEYAHQLHEKIRKIKNHNELKDLIINSILDKYQFIYVKSEKFMKLTEDLKSMLNDVNYIFDNPNLKVVDLESKINHQLNGSGLFSLIFKIGEIFEGNSEEEFINWLLQKYADMYEPTQNDLSWLNKYKDTYQKDYEKDIKKLLK